MEEIKPFSSGRAAAPSQCNLHWLHDALYKSRETKIFVFFCCRILFNHYYDYFHDYFVVFECKKKFFVDGWVIRHPHRRVTRCFFDVNKRTQKIIEKDMQGGSMRMAIIIITKKKTINLIRILNFFLIWSTINHSIQFFISKIN